MQCNSVIRSIAARQSGLDCAVIGRSPFLLAIVMWAGASPNEPQPVAKGRQFPV